MGFKNFLFEDTIASITPNFNLSQEQIKNSFSKLSETEKEQLGKGSIVSAKDWPIVRDFLSRRSKASNSLLNTELTAYTPGETITLLNNPIISSWLKEIVSFKIPENFTKILFVPCAKTKPWKGATKGLYKSYNQLLTEYDDIYFVTISEPLGIVPQDLWEDFPQYDNPGLFKDDAQRSGLFTQDWNKHFGKRMILPFDEEAYNTAINRLAKVIDSFITNNKSQNRIFISFVEDKPYKMDRKGVGTHSDMLNRLSQNPIEGSARYLKRARPRQEPYEHIKSVLDSLNSTH